MQTAKQIHSTPTVIRPGPYIQPNEQRYAKLKSSLCNSKGEWSGGIAPLILESELDGVIWSASHSSGFTPGESIRNPLNRRLGGSQSRSGRFADDINVLSLSGIEQFLERPARSPVTIRSTTSRLCRDTIIYKKKTLGNRGAKVCWILYYAVAF